MISISSGDSTSSEVAECTYWFSMQDYYRYALAACLHLWPMALRKKWVKKTKEPSEPDSKIIGSNLKFMRAIINPKLNPITERFIKWPRLAFVVWKHNGSVSGERQRNMYTLTKAALSIQKNWIKKNCEYENLCLADLTACASIYGYCALCQSAGKNWLATQNLNHKQHCTRSISHSQR